MRKILRNEWRWKYCQNIFLIADGVRYAINLLCMLIVAKKNVKNLLRNASARKQKLENDNKQEENEETLKSVPKL